MRYFSRMAPTYHSHSATVVIDGEVVLLVRTLLDNAYFITFLWWKLFHLSKCL